ncbi:MAG: FAD-dependent oxidoreductase, partial [bacterium]
MTTQLKTRPKPKLIHNKKSPDWDIIIIGGGPAGLTAALYAARSRLKVMIIEKMIMGGMVTTTSHIENYPGFPEGISGMDLGAQMENQVKKLGVTVTWGIVQSIKNSKNEFTVIVDDKSYTAKALIVASGTEAAKIGVPGEDEFRGR